MLALIIAAAAGLPVIRQPNELYNRRDCTTCCRVLFASDMNVIEYKTSTPPNTKWSVIMPEVDRHEDLLSNCGGCEQALMVRPLKVGGHELQYFEFAPFKMLNLFMHPTRVHDFRGAVTIGTRLIQWGKKPPLLESTNNQRFLYVYDYPDSYYTGTVYADIVQYKKHFNCPYYTGGKVCYQTSPVTTQYGWHHVTTFSDRYTRQISVEWCSTASNTGLSQRYTLVFA